MLTPDIDVVRAFPIAELRADAEAADGAAAMPTMEVRFSAFDVWYEIDSWFEGTFLERTVKGAFKRTIREDLQDIKVLFDHGFDPQIGNKVLGPIESLAEETDSPLGVVPLFNTSYNRDLVPGLEAGVYGSSFRFRVASEKWDDEPEPSEANPRGLPERTITGIRLFEFGPVTFPANPSSTAGLRSLTDSYYERLKQRNEQAYDEAVRAAGRKPGELLITDFTGRPGARSAGGGDSSTPQEPVVLISPSTEQRFDTDSLRIRGII